MVAVYFVFDNAGVSSAKIAIKSLICNSVHDIKIIISTNDIAYVRAQLENYKFNRFAHNIKVEFLYDPIDEYTLACLGKSKVEYISNITLYRLTAQRLYELYGQECVFYLDTDLIINMDLYECWNECLREEISIGAVADEWSANYTDSSHPSYYQRLLPNRDKYTYVNAGVIFINCKQWLLNNMYSEFLDVSRKIEDVARLIDQDIINTVFQGRLHYLPSVLNTSMMHEPNMEFNEFINAKIIVHYMGPDKPWKKIRISYRDALYWKYADADSLAQDVRTNFTKYILSHITKYRLKLLLCFSKVKRNKYKRRMEVSEYILGALMEDRGRK